jgi:hypothetical protein
MDRKMGEKIGRGPWCFARVSAESGVAALHYAGRFGSTALVASSVSIRLRMKGAETVIAIPWKDPGMYMPTRPAFQS